MILSVKTTESNIMNEVKNVFFDKRSRLKAGEKWEVGEHMDWVDRKTTTHLTLDYTQDSYFEITS